MKKDFPSFTISEIEDRIILIELKGVEIGLEETIQMYDEVEKIGKGKKVGGLSIFKAYVPPNDEAMKYASGSRPPKLIYASAIVVESLATRLVMMMFMNFNVQQVPRKVFSGKRKALQWLREMREKENRKKIK